MTHGAHAQDSPLTKLDQFLLWKFKGSTSDLRCLKSSGKLIHSTNGEAEICCFLKSWNYETSSVSHIWKFPCSSLIKTCCCSNAHPQFAMLMKLYVLYMCIWLVVVLNLLQIRYLLVFDKKGGILWREKDQVRIVQTN